MKSSEQKVQTDQGWEASCILHPSGCHPTWVPFLTRNTPWAYKWIPSWIPLTIFSRAHLGIPKLAIRAITGTAKNLKGRYWVTRDTALALIPTPWPQLPCHTHTHTHRAQVGPKLERSQCGLQRREVIRGQESHWPGKFWKAKTRLNITQFHPTLNLGS